MSDTPRLAIPEIAAGQAQKHVTHNEAMLLLDALVQARVVSRADADPPGEPEEGECWIVPAGATGAFAGHEGALALWQDGGWRFLAAPEGLRCWIADEATLAVLHEGEWLSLAEIVAANIVPRLGINATADDVNRLALRSNAALLSALPAADGGTGDIRVVVNKETAGDTATLLFQDGYSGRAEIGLAGDDDFRFKVSADGASFVEAIRIDRASGKVALPANGLDPAADLFLNLYPDAGRFGNPQNALPLTSAVTPSYLYGYNGATLTLPAKFIYNNTTYGGAAGDLDPVVEAFLLKYASSAGAKRYGTEWYYLNVVAGAGTSVARTYGADTFHLSLAAVQQPKPRRYTLGVYMRVSTGKAFLSTEIASPGSLDRVLRDGVEIPAAANADLIVTPADGVVYLEVLRTCSDTGYDNQPFFFATSDCEFQIAMPRFVAGHVDIGFDGVGVLLNDKVCG